LLAINMSKIKFRSLGFFLPILFLNIHCSYLEEEESEPEAASSSISEAFLEEADFDSSDNLIAVSSFMVPYHLEYLDFLYNNTEVNSTAATDDDGEVVSDDFDKCISAIENVKMDATVEKITYGADFDFAKCDSIKSIEDTFQIKFKKFRMRFFFEAICTGSDLSGYDGKTTDSLPSGLLCDNLVLLSNTATNTEIVYLSETSDGLISKSDTYSFTGESPTAGCELTNTNAEISYGDGCVDTSITYTTNSQDGVEMDLETEAYHKLSSNNLTDNDLLTEFWHSGGTLTGDIGNWTGAVTYSSGAANPTFAFTDNNAVDADISGTVSNAYELTKNFKNLRSLAKALRTPRIRVKNGIAINPFEVRFK
jgi:hypothetical protein